MHHVIIGGGPAATNAAETIRQFSADAAITLVSDEPPHSRMALPYWLCGNIPQEHTLTGDGDYFQRLNVECRSGVRATGLATEQREVTLSSGDRLSYDRLLIATGSSPAAPPIAGTDLPGVQPLWTLDDTQRVLDIADGIERPRVVLVGAGFIGFIVLAAMVKRGWQATVIERDDQVLPRMLDSSAAAMVVDWLRKKGVQVHTSADVQAIERHSDANSVVLADGQRLEADIVVLATGIRANLDLVANTTIATDQAILVDDRMQTSVEGIFAAGDVAQGPILFSDAREVHAIQPTAVDHGRIAGANMAGHSVSYRGSLLMNIVDVCGLQCVSYGRWFDEQAEPTTVHNPRDSIYRKLLWRGDQLIGAIFVGRANDAGMLNDLGMVKGILQTQTSLGSWKNYLVDNPFDMRRAYVATGVAARLASTTLLGLPTQARQYQFRNAKPASPRTAALDQFLAPARTNAARTNESGSPDAGSGP